MPRYCRNDCGTEIFFVLREIVLTDGTKKNVWECRNVEDGQKHKCPLYSPSMWKMEKYFKDRWVDYSYNALHPLPDGPTEEDE